MSKVPAPAHDPAWCALDMETRDQAYCWMAAIMGLPDNLPVCGTGGIIDRLAKAMGCSKGLAKKRYYAWRDSGGNWRVLVNGNTLNSRASQERVHSPRSIAWGKAIRDKHQRSEQQGILEIQHRIIFGREQMPGFENWTKPTLSPDAQKAISAKCWPAPKPRRSRPKGNRVPPLPYSTLCSPFPRRAARGRSIHV